MFSGRRACGYARKPPDMLLRLLHRFLCDKLSIFRVRLARADERALYHKNAPSLLSGNGELAVLLVELDDPA
jgi:hypothetical protein